MKKKLLIIVSVILALAISVTLMLTVSVASYLIIWGGKPEIENFDKICDDYEIVAQLALNTYAELSPEDEHITIHIYDGNLQIHDSDSNLPLTEEQKNAVQIIDKKFSHLHVYKNAVFFWRDETGYYGLVYSNHPLIALYKNELLQAGREYHRINSMWYEWGVWGI